MPSLDEELARAANDTPDADTRDAAPGVAVRRHHEPPPRNRALLGVLLAVGALVTGLVLNFKEAAVYAKTVDQLMAERGKLAGRSVRVEGTLVKGSLVHQEQPCEYRFRITNTGPELPVRYANCVVPDTFRDVPTMDVKVTVEGKLSEAGTFDASLLMAKCPSKYEMKQRSESGEQAPHAAVPVN